MTADDKMLEMLGDLIERAKKAGADAADAIAVESAELSHAQRFGEIEMMERSESRDLGLRVLIGTRQAIASSSDQREEALADLVERAVAMAKAVPEDQFCGLAEPADVLGGEAADLGIFDPEEPTPEALIERAKAAEEAALAVEGVTNSEGAEASWGRTRIAIVASNGFTGGYAGSRHGVAAAMLAGEGTGMERDYDWSSAVFGEDLDDPAEIGRSAGERAVRRLNPKKMASGKVPVIYDPRVSGGLVRHFAGAINGSAIARGTSFLKDSMDTKVFAEGIQIVDDPHRERGLRSKPFDAEGLANERMNLIEDGVLQTWILDLRSGRQLGLASTGRASRGVSGPPSPSTTNLYMAPGKVSPAELMADIKRGFYITELMGFGINSVTGDYSRGASGFWIEDGEIAHPVSEMTVAGNLKDMFLRMTPADDLTFRFGTDAPTIRVEGMTVAGG